MRTVSTLIHQHDTMIKPTRALAKTLKHLIGRRQYRPACTGIVTSINHSQGYGKISDEAVDGTMLAPFDHMTDDIQAGDTVAYDVILHNGRYEARKIALLD